METLTKTIHMVNFVKLSEVWVLLCDDFLWNFSPQTCGSLWKTMLLWASLHSLPLWFFLLQILIL